MFDGEVRFVCNLLKLRLGEEIGFYMFYIVVMFSKVGSAGRAHCKNAKMICSFLTDCHSNLTVTRLQGDRIIRTGIPSFTAVNCSKIVHIRVK